jgi:hypothetical protein
MKCTPLAFAVLMTVASPVAAQQLTLQIQDGKVTLDAVNVPARQILAEWARIGGTKVVGAEKIVGPPLTLKLVGTPERRALDIVLGSVAGFMAAERQANATPGASAYDRILILATSTAPAQASASRPGQPAGQSANGTQRRVPPRPPNLPQQPVEDDSDEKTEAENQEGHNPANPPVFSFPGAQNGNAPAFVPINQGNAGIFGGAAQPGMTQPGVVQPGMTSPPVITLQPNPNGQPTIFNFVPNGQGYPQPLPTPGFGAGSPTPGMIQQPQPPQQPQQPQQPNRPPGQ